MKTEQTPTTTDHPHTTRYRPVQYFTPEYLVRCRQMSKEQVLAFLEDFAQLQQAQRLKD